MGRLEALKVGKVEVGLPRNEKSEQPYKKTRIQ